MCFHSVPLVLAATSTLALLTTGSLPGQDPAPAEQSQKIEIYEVSTKRKPTVKGAPFFGSQGLEIKLITRLAGKTVLELDKKASKLSAWKDDAGTDLGSGADKGFFFWARLESGFRNTPKDLARITLRTKTLPARAAKRITLDAQVAVITASGTDRAKADVELQKDALIKVGPFRWKVRDVKPSKRNGTAIQVSFESSESMTAVQKIELFDAAGKPMKTQKMMSSSFRMGGKRTYIRSVGLEQPLDKGSMQVTFHKGMETVIVPVKVELGLGL